MPDEWIIKLFAKMQAVYTAKWRSTMDDPELYKLAKQEWKERLSGLTGKQIKQGINKLPSDWPPTPMEFRELCEGDQEHRTAAYKMYDKSRMLEVKKADPSVARRELDKIKETLR